MAESVTSELILSLEQHARADRINSVVHEIAELSRQRRNGAHAETELTLAGLGGIVAQNINRSKCPAGRPNVSASVVSGGFTMSCASACMAALTKRCPLARLSEYVDQELEGLSLQTQADLVAAQQAA